MHRFLFASLCLCFGQAAMADQTRVFEWHDAAGHLSYSNVAPSPGAEGVTSREVETRSFTPAQKVAIGAQLARMDATGLAESKRFQDRLPAADLAVDAALRRLTRAEDALRTERTPRAGDRTGTAAGDSRLRVEFFDASNSSRMPCRQRKRASKSVPFARGRRAVKSEPGRITLRNHVLFSPLSPEWRPGP